MWNNDLKVVYKNEFNVNEMETIDEKLSDLDCNSVTQCELDSIVDDLNNLCIDTAKSLGMCQEVMNIHKSRNVNNSSPSKNKPRFDKSCDLKRKEYLKDKRKLKRVNTDEAKSELRGKAKEYKKFILKAFRDYNRDVHVSMRNLKSNNPKEYWNILNKASNSAEKSGNFFT